MQPMMSPPKNPLLERLAQLPLSKRQRDALFNAAIGEGWQQAQEDISRIKLQRRYSARPDLFGVELLGEHYTKEIIEVMQSIKNNPVTEAKSANSVGKTHGAARVAVWFYKSFPGAQVYTTAAPPYSNLQRQLWGEIGSIVDKAPHLFKNDTVTSMHIQSSSLSFLTGVAIPMSGTSKERESKFSGKHAPYLLFIVDEGDAVPEEVYAGIESCMSGGFARLLIMFNPRAEAGPAYEKERKRQANVIQISALTHPNVVTGENKIPGAVDRETTVRRINEWTRIKADDESVEERKLFTPPPYLVGYVARALSGDKYPPLSASTRVIKEDTFFYMVLGTYPPEGEQQLISTSDIYNARSRWDLYVAQYGEKPPLGIRPVLGGDIAEFGSDSNAGCLRYGGWVARFQTWSGLDTDASAMRFYNLYVQYDCERAGIDATGIGSGVAPRMVRLGRGEGKHIICYGVKVASSPTIRDVEQGEFLQLRDQLWWCVREWLRTDPGAMLPPDELLIEELRIPTYHKMESSGKIKIMSKDTMRELLHRSPDRADGLCLTFAPAIKAKVLSLEG